MIDLQLLFRKGLEAGLLKILLRDAAFLLLMWLSRHINLAIIAHAGMAFVEKGKKNATEIACVQQKFYL